MTTPLLKFIRNTVQSLPHCQKLGLNIDSLEQGKGSISLLPKPELVGNQEFGLLHSAVVTTLLDTLCGTVASSAFPEGRTVATLDLRLDHLEVTVAHKPLYGRAECFHINDDVAYLRGWAWQEGEDKPIAKATGTFMAGGSFQLQKGKNV